MELYIVWTQDVPESNSLKGFPYGEGQTVRRAFAFAGSGMATWIDLGENVEDTTPEQDAWLNACKFVKSYEVV